MRFCFFLLTSFSDAIFSVMKKFDVCLSPLFNRAFFYLNGFLLPLIFSLALVIAPNLTFAEPTEVPPPWNHESELGIVTVSGNTESETYNAKQITSYRWNNDSLSLTGRYLESKARSIITAKSWEIGTRYEKFLSDLWAGFIGQKAESDPFSGYVQKDSTDIGAKYFIRNTTELNWFTELGLSYLKTLKVGAQTNQNDLSTRLYTEANLQLEKNLSFKYWLEYIQSQRRPEVYFLNTEASLNIMLSERFSVKTGYLLKYHNELIPPTEKYSDTSFTTSLVAHF
jgi:putative salt-induced outer membrane protein